MSWKNIEILEIQNIKQVVAEFYITCIKYVPNYQFKVKITEDVRGNYSGRINIAIKNLENNSPEWIGGSGVSIDEALENSLNEFINSIKSSGKDLNNLIDEDFEWSATEDF